MFEKKNINTLPEHCQYDCIIDLEEGWRPPFGAIYNLSQDELTTLCEYINENLENGFIWHSKSIVGASILFVKNTNGSLWMCVVYHGLHWFTIKNQYPSSLKLLNRAKMYTKIDLWGHTT
jgi:hypothetical protein